MIQIKDHDVLETLLIHAAHPILIELLKWVVVRYSKTIFTLGFEERKKPSVHSVIPYRGADIRSRIYDDPKSVEKDINSHWQYDPKRPTKQCAKYHDTGRGLHIHLQVHNNTLYKRRFEP